jgi:biopolymer transport protein ExbB
MKTPRLFLALFVALAAPAGLLAQSPAVAEAGSQVIRKSLLGELSVPAIWPLWLCSALIIYLVVDLTLKTGLRAFITPEAVKTLRDRFRAGDYRGAYAWCVQNPAPLTNIIGAGLKHAGGGKQASEEAMAAQIVGENSRFQNRIAYLSVIGVIAPMIGLTGTVIGMIQAFAAMGQAGAADPSKLSGAIGHVLHATAAGLAVAIPAFVAYYLLRNRVSHAIHEISGEVNELYRRFPYNRLDGLDFEGAEACAAAPDWETAPVPENQG